MSSDNKILIDEDEANEVLKAIMIADNESRMTHGAEKLARRLVSFFGYDLKDYGSLFYRRPPVPPPNETFRKDQPKFTVEHGIRGTTNGVISG